MTGRGDWMARPEYAVPHPAGGRATPLRETAAVGGHHVASGRGVGPRARPGAGRAGPRHTLPVVTTSAYPGQALGLPAAGPGSVARFGRRLVAVLVDWVLCLLVATGLFHVRWGETGGGSFVPLAVFAVENLVLVSLTGSTIGHRLLGLRVGSLGRPFMTPVQVLVRTLLLCLFIPAVIWDKDGRGLHDRAAGTVIVRR